MKLDSSKNIVSIKDITLTLKVYDELFNLYCCFGELDSNVLNIERFSEIINIIKNNSNHEIFLYCDNSQNILGAVTCIIEQKIIHNGGIVLHIEDFVVKKENRKTYVGNCLIDYIIDYAKKNNCYKVILDCNNKLEKYYRSLNLIKSKNIVDESFIKETLESGL